ncbi:dihydrolipoamide acetyltransferase family protein [Natronomonas marina]|jgi:pyruvate dehydrogenase E2 component (dihydrolipoamide acetyltransferase)|uniref:dihydrolipoamide acetyltransferase family protein n=1 Tax=Natronomonas marina TaxID=2961939 RepID=UPI0020CA140E|nr:dihydrolipoamide acetyltransferase family protein [Natronomonas marina]
MVREFKLPDVGEGLTEAEIVDWLVEPGDTVKEDQPVAEVETDKAVVEVPAPVNGTVREILAEAGEMVPVGNVIITFDVEGEAVQEEPTDAEAAAADEAADAGEAGDATTEAEPAETADAGDVSETEGRVFAAPSARRVARELGVDIGSVEGSGPGGRVTEADVRAAAESGGAAGEADESGDGQAVESATRRVDDEGDAAATTPTDADGATPAESADRDRTLAAPATRKLAEEEGVDLDAVPTDERKDGEAFVTEAQVQQYAEAQQRAQAADAEAVSAGGESAAVEAAGEDERIPYRGVRRTIGQQMERSKFTAPHVTHHDQVDVTGLVEARGRLKERAEERGTKLTYMPFVVKAVVAALKEHPILNSQLDEDDEEILVRGDYNIGVATATDAGLMVPVVKGADRKGMLEIADEMRDLVESARERSIAREDMQGGTFTITNFGAIGGEYATPIINYPETAILGLGAIEERPWVVEREAQGASDGANGDAVSKEVEARKVMTLSLSIDHRVIDGADAAQFVNTVKEYLETPELLLLE